MSTRPDTGTDQISVSSTDAGAVPGMRAETDPLSADDDVRSVEGLPGDVTLPVLRGRSGVYTRRRILPSGPVLPSPLPNRGLEETETGDLSESPDDLLPDTEISVSVPSTFPTAARYRYGTEELRIDIDGRAPTMTISGVIPGGLFARRLTWIARVTRTAAGTYAGPISYRDGTSALLPQSRVEVALNPAVPIGDLKAAATFSGGGAPTITRQFTFARSYFRKVHFEFDRVSDATAVTEYDTAAHPNRPANLPAEMLTIKSGYAHMGIRVTRSGDSTIHVSGAGADTLWSDIEMHDAMQVNWSKWEDIPQWAVWVLFARQHESGPSLGGIMFDDIGTAQRQGCAIFSQSFVSTAPAGDPAPNAWVQRMLFWTAMHEIGHSFNLAHSWQKSLGTGWVPLANEVEERSYMNYPYRVAAAPGKTQEQTFFANFHFRFSEDELLFMRHAPERLVQHGNALWFDHHAFEEARATTSTPLELVARVHRAPRFEFLEPVTIELKLKNVTSSPIVVDRRILEGDRVSLVVTRRHGEPRVIRPYAKRCYAPDDTVLMPEQSLYASMYVSSDAYGFAVDEPGEYAVYAMLDLDEVDVLAQPLAFRVMPPASRDEERIAPDVFSDGVGRTLAFGGTRVIGTAKDTLAEVADRLEGRPISVHAQAALGAVAARPGKVLERGPDETTVRVEEADVDTALNRLSSAYSDLDVAATTFGHIDVTKQVLDYAETVKEAGDASAAAGIAGDLADTLAARGVKPTVVDATRAKAAELGS